MAFHTTHGAKRLPYSNLTKPPPTSFSNSVEAVAMVIGGIGDAVLAITTTDNHRGSGPSAGLLLPKPAQGRLYFNSWDKLQLCTTYSIVANGEDLSLNFFSGRGTGEQCVGILQATMAHAYDQDFNAGPSDFRFWYFPQNKQDVRFSILSGEIITAGTNIEVHTTETAKRDLDAFHIVRDGKHFDTYLSGLNPIEVLTSSLSAGRYNLVVGELLNYSKNKRLNDFYSVVEFIVSDKVPKKVNLAKSQLVHFTNMQLNQGIGGNRPVAGLPAPQNDDISHVKVIHRDTGELTSLAFEENGTAVDVAKHLAEAENRHFSRFGFIHEPLSDHLQKVHDTEVVDIVVWTHMESHVVSHGAHPMEPPSRIHPSFAAVLSARDIIRDFIQDQGGVINLYPTDEPYLYASVPKRMIQALSEIEQVGGVFLDDHSAEIDLANSIAVAKSASVVAAGYSGEEIHVAVHEDGPSDLKNLELAGRYTETPESGEGGKKNAHARLTHAIVKNVEPNCPHGHAPGCKLYSANAETNAALEWALDQDCTVVSQSYHRGSGTTSTSLLHDDILKDWKATKWPFPTFTLASGNFFPNDGKLYVNHKSYNSLKVGSHHDNGLEMAATSEYRNPPTPNMDRELPEVAANGTVVGANEQLKSGTSFAAPAVAGVVALIQQMDPRLKRYPEVCRAIIFASANLTVVGGTWWGDIAAKVDGKAGAGSLDAERGMNIATKPQYPYAPPSPNGWDFGYFTADDFENGVANAKYYVEVPSAPKTTAASMSYVVKAAFTWNSKVSSTKRRATSSKLTVDLDLFVRDANRAIIAVSASFDNNYEIVEFYVQPGNTYEFSIVKSSGIPDTRYGIAWTVREIPWAVKRP